MEGSGVAAVLVGREREVALAERCAREGTPCVLAGESGIGKTAVAGAVAAACGPAFVGGGLSTLAWVPYVPLRLALGRRAPSGDDAHVADEVAHRVGEGLLVIDDLQWADGATRRVVELLAGRTRLLTAVRTDEPAAAAALELCERAGMEVIRLEPLGRDASLELLDSLRDDLPRPRALRLVARARGNPLFLRELAASDEPSESFRLALAARIRRLSPLARDALALLALLGRPAPETLLEPAAAAELLERGFADRAGDVVAIRHPLFAEIAAAELEEADRRQLHARLARLVDDRGEAAHHLAAAGLRAQAGEVALAAAAETSSPAERAALLALAARAAAGEEHVELSLRAARELADCGEFQEAERLLAELPPLEGHDLARAACVLWETRYELGDLAGSRAAVERGLPAAGRDPALVTELRLAEVSLALLDERYGAAERLRKAAAGWRLARRHGIRVARAAYLHGTALYLSQRPEWVKQLALAVDEARRAGDAESELTAAYNAISGHESFCRPEEARALAEEMVLRSRELHLAAWERRFRSTIVNLDLHLGRYESVVREGAALLEEGLDPRRRDVVEIAVALALVDLGRFEEAGPRIERLLAAGASDIRGQGLGAWLRAEAELWGGRARRALDSLAPFLEREDVGVFEPFGRVVEAWARFELELPVSAWSAPELPPILDGVAPELEGLAALSAGRAAEAARLLRRAAGAYAGSHLRGELRCLLGEGIALRDGGEREGARELLLAVEERAQAHGMAPLVARTQRSLRLLGERRTAPRHTAVGGLTTREAEVLELAAAGLTNAAIARRLGIGPSTVKRLVSSGARKLGAGTRAQAVTLFAER